MLLARHFSCQREISLIWRDTRVKLPEQINYDLWFFDWSVLNQSNNELHFFFFRFWLFCITYIIYRNHLYLHTFIKPCIPQVISKDRLGLCVGVWVCVRVCVFACVHYIFTCMCVQYKNSSLFFSHSLSLKLKGINNVKICFLISLAFGLLYLNGISESLQISP